MKNRAYAGFFAELAVLAPALAHDGHALASSHWHATDTWGFGVLALALAAAWWLGKGGK